MKTKNIIIFCIGCVLFLSSQGLAACIDLKGLPEKRQVLLEQYKVQVGNNYLANKATADNLSRQIEEIDSIYRKAIYDLFFEFEGGEYKTLNTCFDKYKNDDYLFFVCKFIKFNRDNDPVSFLKDLPTDGKRLDYLWELDEITNTGKSENHPDIFNKASFSVLFLDAIYKLAIDGNSVAIDKFLKIGKCADGEYGEYWDDKIFDLFKNYPGIVIKNWKVIKKNQHTIDLGTTNYPYESKEIIKIYRKRCSKSNENYSSCKEIIQFLQNKSQELKGSH